MGDLVRFPVERREAVEQYAHEQHVQQAAGGNFHLTTATVSFTGMTFTGTGMPEVVTPPAPQGQRGESWWERVPEVEWVKIGFFPAAVAKQHKLLNVVVSQLGSGLVLVAFAVCGRRGALSEHFDENVSGGHCRRCATKR